MKTKFGYLSVIKEVERRNGRRFFLCRCDCGIEKVIRLDFLKNGNTKSCGCYSKGLIKNVNLKHGMANKHPLHSVWNSIKQRCLNPKSSRYKYYGARGISVCEEWLDFIPFYEWAISHGYKNYLTIERKNNDGDYCPENCTFVGRKKQANNRRTSKYIVYKSLKKTLAQWGDLLDINPTVLCKRLIRGWSPERTIETPCRKK
ncbi:MAG: hypothetical protein WC454_09300 [Phycisphaerae bacterium]|jgi:hypothetical protein